ncbi:MAG: PAS domain-containing protein [Alphaproteobacteria bacterium]|uniref:PAS domain-containing protein n=1 Tax=Pacificispira sp. TaxID=2888761 RepID=UPI002EA78A1E|nr:PAS domain-containing protein [Pseudomonadota bacterium]
MSGLEFDLSALDHSSIRIRRIFDYWNDIRAGRPMPAWSDFDPADIRHHLPGIILIDVEAPRPDGTFPYRYRVVGQWEVDARGHNPTGSTVDEGFYGPALESALSDYDTVRSTAGPLYAPLDFIDSRGLHVDEYSILLPFTDKGTRVDKILVYSERRVRPDCDLPY